MSHSDHQNWQEVAKILRRWFGKVAIIEWLLRWEDSKFNGTRGICYCVCWWTLSFTVSKKAVKRWEYGWAATYTTYKCKQSKPLLWVVKRRILPLREDQQLKIITRCQPVSTAFFYDQDTKGYLSGKMASQSINSITLSINWSAESFNLNNRQ